MSCGYQIFSMLNTADQLRLKYKLIITTKVAKLIEVSD